MTEVEKAEVALRDAIDQAVLSTKKLQDTFVVCPGCKADMGDALKACYLRLGRVAQRMDELHSAQAAEESKL